MEWKGCVDNQYRGCTGSGRSHNRGWEISGCCCCCCGFSSVVARHGSRYVSCMCEILLILSYAIRNEKINSRSVIKKWALQIYLDFPTFYFQFTNVIIEQKLVYEGRRWSCTWCSLEQRWPSCCLTPTYACIWDTWTRQSTFSCPGKESSLHLLVLPVVSVVM